MTTPSDLALVRFLRGESSHAERLDVEAWLASDPAAQSALHAIAKLIAPPGRTKWDVDAQWTDVKAAIGHAGRPTPRHVIHIPKARVRVPWAAIAATGVLAAGLIAFYFNQPPAPARRVAPPFREYTTRRGERASIQLADGSRVTLAPQSLLRIPDDYGVGRRRVELTGEAMFVVQHDSANAFQVRTRGTVVEDVGTRFDVRSYDADSLLVVAVAEGAVSVGDSSSTAVTVPHGSVAVRERSGATRVTSAATLSRYFGWTAGKLSFENEPLEVVLRDIGRWYDLDIRMGSRALASKRITADFSTQQPRQMLAALAAAVNGRVFRDGRLITLTDGGQ